MKKLVNYDPNNTVISNCYENPQTQKCSPTVHDGIFILINYYYYYFYCFWKFRITAVICRLTHAPSRACNLSFSPADHYNPANVK